MLFAEVFRSAMFGLLRYTGRSDRLEQWTFCLLTAIGVLAYVVMLRNGVRMSGSFLWLTFLASGWVALAHVALMVRRLHDHGVSGFYLMIPLVGLCIMGVGILGRAGYVAYLEDPTTACGFYVQWTGRAVVSLSSAYLVAIFLTPGSESENRFGEPD